jgi:hypothetical protein
MMGERVFFVEAEEGEQGRGMVVKRVTPAEILAEIPTVQLIEELRRRGLAYAAESRTDRNGNHVVPLVGPWFGWIVSLSAEQRSRWSLPERGEH